MRNDSKTRRTAGLGIMFALAVVLQVVESLVPSPFTFAPGIKLGLSNIVTMFCLFTFGLPDAISIALLKGLFAFITRGPAAGILSAAGGAVSVLVMRVMSGIGSSRGLISVFGAVAHNLAQLTAECIMMKSSAALYYAPVLIISGIIMGSITALVLRATLPYIEKLSLSESSREDI